MKTAQSTTPTTAAFTCNPSAPAEINDFLADPDNPLVRDFLAVVAKFGTPEEINEKAAEARKLRSEEHTSELQSRFDLVCRLLLEKKKNNTLQQPISTSHPRSLRK